MRNKKVDWCQFYSGWKVIFHPGHTAQHQQRIFPVPDRYWKRGRIDAYSRALQLQLCFSRSTQPNLWILSIRHIDVKSEHLPNELWEPHRYTEFRQEQGKSKTTRTAKNWLWISSVSSTSSKPESSSIIQAPNGDIIAMTWFPYPSVDGVDQFYAILGKKTSSTEIEWEWCWNSADKEPFYVGPS